MKRSSCIIAAQSAPGKLKSEEYLPNCDGRKVLKDESDETASSAVLGYMETLDDCNLRTNRLCLMAYN